MPAYIFSCPVCGKRFKLTPNNPMTLAQQTFTCPSCRYTAPLTTLIKELTPPVSTSQNITLSNEIGAPKTKAFQYVPTKVSPINGQQGKAFVTVIGSNERFVLNQGAYILGRKSSDSTATLQLAPDISMSRQHARLALQNVGGKLTAQLVGLKVDNPVIVNGKSYTAGKPCTLKSGDRIQLGQTRMVFTI